MRGPEAVGPRVAAPEDDDVLALGGDPRGRGHGVACDDAVLLFEVLHREVYAG